MSTDRELLEKAAQAAGYAVNVRRQRERDDIGFGHVGLWITGESTCWNPLIDSGHALMLAVKLRLDVCVSVCRVGDTWYNADADLVGVEAATRRAIVRAAALLAD